MKLLLTSAGIKNPSIHEALIDLLGKPIAEASALAIPTANHPRGGPQMVWSFLHDEYSPVCELGWKSMGVLELTALTTIDKEYWTPFVRETDVLLVNGGDPLYLSYWMRASGLADLFRELTNVVYVGLSAGSMVLAPRIGEDFVHLPSPDGGDDRTLGLVDFSIFPHLDNPDLPDNIIETATKWAADLAGPAYAIDDETAIRVVDGTVDVVSEGHWTLFNA